MFGCNHFFRAHELRTCQQLAKGSFRNMTSLVTESFHHAPNFTRKIDNGISIDVLIFGESLVAKALEAAMAEVQPDSDDEFSVNNGAPSEGDGFSKETGEQEKVDVKLPTLTHNDTVYDEVDADSQIGGSIKLTDDQSINNIFDQEKNGEPLSKGETEANTGVPKIEITESSTTLSDSSSDEDSDGRKEDKEKKRRKKKKKKSKETEEDEQGRLIKENETMKERIENLSKEKILLEETLSVERNEVKTLRDELISAKEEFQEQRRKQTNELGEDTAAAVQEKEKLITELRFEIQQLQDDISKLKQDIDISQKDKEEEISSSRDATKDLENRVKILETEITEKTQQLRSAAEDVNKSLGSLREEEKLTSSLKEEVELLKTQVKLLQEDILSKEEGLNKALEREQKTTQENSKLQAKLSNAQTLSAHHDSVVQKLRNEIASLQDKNMELERKSSQIEQRVMQESNRKLQDRIRELEEKVIKLNEEKKKIKTDYDEAVRALEAVDKVYSVREDALEKYKADYEEATDKLKESEREITRLKSDLSRNKEKLTRALEYKADREELKDHLRKSKEAIVLQKEETEQVRKDLDDERHDLRMAQTRSQERGRKIQMLNLELSEVKDTLQIARNVIEEKENNMKNIKDALAAEKEQKVKLEKKLEIMSHLEEKLKYVEEEKQRLECRLKNRELELKETQTSLEESHNKRKEQDEKVDLLDKDKKRLNDQLEDKAVEINNLNKNIFELDQDIGEKLREIVQVESQLDELRTQYWDLWNSYQNDREWWKQRAEKVLGRRPKSAPQSRRGPPGEYHNGGLSLASRRLMNRIGPPRLNPTYIKSRHKITRTRPASAFDGQVPRETSGENIEVKVGSPPNGLSPDGTTQTSAFETSPRPPSAPPPGRPRPKRPASSYGIRSHPTAAWPQFEGTGMFGSGYYSDVGPLYNEEDDFNEYDASDEVLATCAVHKGDRVMIQSKITGEEKMNVTGLVKYVGKLGNGGNTSSMFVGLKLDQPVGDTDGHVAGKQYFQCPPNQGKVVKLSDIHAKMNPRTRTYSRVRPMTFDF